MKKLLTIAILMTTVPSLAQNLPDPTPNFIAIIVSDFEKSMTWYQTTFEMQVISQSANEERGFKQGNLKRGSFQIELIELDNSAKPEGRSIGFFKFGLAVKDFNDWISKLEKLEVEFRGQVVLDKITGKKMVIILDPDGNRIQLFEE